VIVKILIKSILFFALCFIHQSLLAQDDECAFYIEKIKKAKFKTISSSHYPLNFVVSENLTASLGFSDRGTDGLYLILKFLDNKGYQVELGNILTLEFEDGSQTAFISRSKRLSTSTATFTLWQATSQEISSTKYDPTPYEKLCRENISALSLWADYEVRRVQIPQTQSEIIRKIIQCLVKKPDPN
jgi:hypothetical protein